MFINFSRLGVRLHDSTKGGFMVHHNSESSLVVEVKSKQSSFIDGCEGIGS